MSFELFNTLTAYGDQIGFHTKFNEHIILDKLKEFSDDWTEYNPNDLEKYNKPSNKTIDYYKRTLAEGERPLLWLFIPHILYKGSIDTSKLKIIEVE